MSAVNRAPKRGECSENEEEDKYPRMTKESLRRLCKETKGYLTPHLNDILYLHYKGYTKIENLEEYTGLKCLWLESNGISCIENLEAQRELRSLYLHHNLISTIQNLEHLERLDTLNLSHNNLHHLQNLSTLPALHTLNVSHNRLQGADDIRELEHCLALGVLDLSHNNIDDVSILDVLGTMANLRVLTLTGNPVIKSIPHYRKTVTLACKHLTYLDARPVFEKDRRCAEAWEKGGMEAERAMRKELQDAENKRISDSVNALMRIRRARDGDGAGAGVRAEAVAEAAAGDTVGKVEVTTAAVAPVKDEVSSDDSSAAEEDDGDQAQAAAAGPDGDVQGCRRGEARASADDSETGRSPVKRLGQRGLGLGTAGRPRAELVEMIEEDLCMPVPHRRSLVEEIEDNLGTLVEEIEKDDLGTPMPQRRALEIEDDLGTLVPQRRTPVEEIEKGDLVTPMPQRRTLVEEIEKDDLGTPMPQRRTLVEEIEEDDGGPPSLSPSRPCPQPDRSLLALEDTLAREACGGAGAGAGRAEASATQPQPRILVEELAAKPGPAAEAGDKVTRAGAGADEARAEAGRDSQNDTPATDDPSSHNSGSESLTEEEVVEPPRQESCPGEKRRDEHQAMVRLQSLVTELGNTKNAKLVVPEYEWIRGHLGEAEQPGWESGAVREGEGEGAGGRADEGILDYRTIALRLLAELRARDDLTAEERAIMESIPSMAGESEDESEPSEDEASGAGAPSSDGEDANDVVVAELRTLECANTCASTCASTQTIAQTAAPGGTGGEARQATVSEGVSTVSTQPEHRESRSNAHRTQRIKMLLDQHENLFTMAPEERKELTNQLVKHVARWEKHKNKVRKNTDDKKTCNEECKLGPVSLQKDTSFTNIKDFGQDEADNITSESDDEVEEGATFRNVSKTLEMQLASLDVT
ncbi:Dynein assembly factor 1, axonemal [Frankliniella fusca]|uniref:Dynein axonemal assembly factor 1 homolog n=1 Tax=Frankliniella fusca TaxID=407009 RepID=A0AAE1GSD4_9NEOP|nr:Dynein assembly factor 1, axonemal [Frankliniella fusca]